MGVSMNRSTPANSTISSKHDAICAPAHAEDGPVQVHVLAPRQLGMKAGTYLEERPEPPSRPRAAACRLGDPRDDLEERGLAGAVPPNDADRLSLLHLE